MPPLESLADAQELVEQAVLNLRMAGFSADGEVCSTRDLHVANRIVERLRIGIAKRSSSDPVGIGESIDCMRVVSGRGSYGSRLCP